ncbi:hypothetical protein PGQ11_001485 [Apiospora arundinis]|uniref:Uncharacterized protein n=1 Tax=Apiospora arundinis TaxID=335852 RepID=A0ABR2JNZ3_9PEZI
MPDTKQQTSSTNQYGDSSGGRPRIEPDPKKSKYRVQDKVYLLSGRTQLGPYTVDDIVSPRVYTLSDGNGNRVNNGAHVAEKDLILC